MWDDFFKEPSEFDEQVEEFKESLRASVKEEIVAELEGLRKENASFQEIRNDWHAAVRKLEGEYAAKQRELEKAIRQAREEAENAKRTRLEQLMEEVAPVAWTLEYESIKKPKCDMCDKNRKRHFITPLGRKSYEDCKCAEVKQRAHVKRAPITKMYTDVRGVLRVFYMVSSKDGIFDRDDSNFFDETPFEDILRYRPLFHSESRARRYAAWLNKKAGVE